MILELAIAAALVIAPPVEDVQLPTCSVGEEAQPFEDGYVCGPADPAIPNPQPTLTSGPAPAPTESAPAPSSPAVETPAATADLATPAAPAVPALAETGVADEHIDVLAVFAATATALGVGIVLTLMLRRGPGNDDTTDGGHR